MDRKTRLVVFIEKYRLAAFVVLPIIMFSGFSANLLILAEHDWFARLGAGMVAWAILNLSIRREQYFGAAVRWDRHRVAAHLNQMRDLQQLYQESLDLTFDIHASQIAQIALTIDAPNPFVENSAETVEAFCENVRKRMETTTVTEDSKAAVEKLRQLEEEYRSGMKENLVWSRWIWRTEVILLVWGTLQWGYGDLLVIWYHDLVPCCL